MVENVAPKQTWDALAGNPEAHLVDVRTDAEWAFVGVPDLNPAGKQTLLIPWQVYPTMQRNGAFVDHLRQAGLTPDHHIYFICFICRSGVRSMAAAEAAEAAGFPNVYNVADGFEGPPDHQGHRGATAGWKADGLPWRQQ